MALGVLFSTSQPRRSARGSVVLSKTQVYSQRPTFALVTEIVSLGSGVRSTYALGAAQ